jgi:pimeloyl-ACP methyl ester carboxylesterase
MDSFEHAGHRLAYTEHGAGDRVVVLVHGLLLSQKLMTPLARELADRGHRAVTLDLLGHGLSDRPTAMQDYSMTGFGASVLALLDHLGVEEAVVGGVSLGANTTLEAAAMAPERIRAGIISMPVLDNALLGCAIAFTPLMCGLTFGAPVARALGGALRRVPTQRSWFLDVVLDTMRQDPKPSAAVLQGLFFNRVAPPREIRRTLELPALVIGHDRDPVHPFSDVDALVREMPNARLVRSTSLLELPLAPKRLNDEIGRFLDGVWAPTPRRGGASQVREVA